MVRTRHSDETDDFKNGDFISIEERTKRLQKKDKVHEDGSDDSGVIQFRPTRTREAPDEKLDLSPRAKRAAAKRVSYVEDCIDEVGEDSSYATRRRRGRKPVVSDDDDDSDNGEEESPKQAARYTGNVGPRRRNRLSETPTSEVVVRSRRRTADYIVAHPSPSRQLKQEALDDLESGGARRSLRQRKMVYGTVNEKQLDPAMNYEESGQRRKRRRLEVEDEDKQEEEPEEEPDEDGFTDMYSRVKRKRKTVKRDMYGIPIEESSEEEESEDSEDSSDDDSDDDDSSDDDNENDDEDEKEGDDHDGVKDSKDGPKSYFLRQNKPRTQLYNAPVEGLYS